MYKYEPENIRLLMPEVPNNKSLHKFAAASYPSTE